MKKWTVCKIIGGKVKKICQYDDADKAASHAKSIDGFACLYPVNPERLAKVGGRRSIECYRKVGLPQY